MLRFVKHFSLIFFLIFTNIVNSAEKSEKLLTTDWTFKGPFGKFDRDAGANYRKVKSYFENLGLSIQEYMLKNDGAYDDSDDDW